MRRHHCWGSWCGWHGEPAIEWQFRANGHRQHGDGDKTAGHARNVSRGSEYQRSRAASSGRAGLAGLVEFSAAAVLTVKERVPVLERR